MPNSCVCCGHVKRKNENICIYVSFFSGSQGSSWRLVSLNLTEGDITEQSRICSKHFLHGHSLSLPVLSLGRRFASPRKSDTERNSRAIKQALRSPYFCAPVKRLSTPSPSSCASSVNATGDEPSMGESLLSDRERVGSVIVVWWQVVWWHYLP